MAETIPASCHPNRRHLARGLCRPCYEKLPQRRAQKRAWNKTDIGRATTSRYEKSPVGKAAQARKRKRPARKVVQSKYNLKKRLADRGITQHEYAAMITASGGHCQICGTSPPRLCLDHSHENGRARGLLCDLCNRGLGHFKDDANVLRSALKYLERML